MSRLTPLLLVSLLLPTAVFARDFGPISSRPRAITLEQGPGGPTGYFGAMFGWTLPQTPWAAEAGFGLGATGWQVALQAKRFFQVGNDGSYLTLQAGPSLGMLGKPLGTEVPTVHPVEVGNDTIYWILFMNAGIGWEGRGAWGGIMRVAAGAWLNVANTQADLCLPNDNAPGPNECHPMFAPSGPEVAELRVFPWVAVGYGWAF